MARGAPGPFVPLEDFEWLAEVQSRETPEDALIAREDEDEDSVVEHDRIAERRSIASGRLDPLAARLPPREALALAAYLGLGGAQRSEQIDIGRMLGGASQQVVSYMVKRARARIAYLATRPALDVDLLARHLSPSQLETVRLVYEHASFREAWRRQDPDPPANPTRSWKRTRDRRVKRTFMAALAKLEARSSRPEFAAQSAALRHVLSHLGILSRHEGKGRYRRAAHRPDAAAPSAS